MYHTVSLGLLPDILVIQHHRLLPREKGEGQLHLSGPGIVRAGQADEELPLPRLPPLLRLGCVQGADLVRHQLGLLLVPDGDPAAGQDSLVLPDVSAALVQGGEGWWIIDARGKLLEQVSAPTVRPDLAKVTGVTALLPTAGTKLAVAEEEQTKLSSLTRLLTAMENRAMLGRVGAIDLTAAARLTFLYDGRITVKLPLVDEKVEAKLEGLERAMESIQDNERGTLDLTRDIGERWYFDPE